MTEELMTSTWKMLGKSIVACGFRSVSGQEWAKAEDPNGLALVGNWLLYCFVEELGLAGGLLTTITTINKHATEF